METTCTSAERGIGENGMIEQDTWSLTTALLASLEHTGKPSWDARSDSQSILSTGSEGRFYGEDPLFGCATQRVTPEELLEWDAMNLNGYP